MPPIEELENEERQDIVTHLQNILNQLDITLSALKATGTETPRTLSNVYDQITSILSQFDLTLTSLRDAIVNATTPTDLLAIYNQLAATLPRNITTWGGTAVTGRDISADLANLDIALSALRDAIVNATTPTDLLDISNQLQKLINALVSVATDSLQIKIQSVLAKKAETYAADETLAQSISLAIGGFKQAEVRCHATAATTFTVEYSFDNTHFYTYYSSASTETDYSDVFWTAAQYIKVSSAAAGAAGDTVDLIIGAKP